MTTVLSTLRRSWRTSVLITALIVVFIVVSLLSHPATSDRPLSLDNPSSNGLMALGNLLRDEGVDIVETTSLESTLEEVRSASGATIALIHGDILTSEDRAALAESGADVTILMTDYGVYDGLTTVMSTPGSLSYAPQVEKEDSRIHAESGDDGELTVSANVPSLQLCRDPDALAVASLGLPAGALTQIGALTLRNDAEYEQLTSNENISWCFTGDDRETARDDIPRLPSLYASQPLPHGGTLRLISEPFLLTNSDLTRTGQAALGIRALGHQPTLVWFDAARLHETHLWTDPLRPAWLTGILMQSAIVLGLVALIRGRRFGAVVTEELPVSVQSRETTIGRGRLYQRSKNREAAARALREGTIMRLRKQLGVSPSAPLDHLITRLTAVTRLPAPTLWELLNGAIPTDDRSLTILGMNLSQLENEVRHS